MKRVGFKMSSASRKNCPGIRELTRPTLRYLKCQHCGGDIEIWSDEEKGTCIDCGGEWTKPNNKGSCLDYCEYAEKCKEIVGK
jgi:hypothetical protein